MTEKKLILDKNHYAVTARVKDNVINLESVNGYIEITEKGLEELQIWFDDIKSAKHISRLEKIVKAQWRYKGGNTYRGAIALSNGNTVHVAYFDSDDDAEKYAFMVADSNNTYLLGNDGITEADFIKEVKMETKLLNFR